jgi:ABC-2 type transport system ATP-binding protein
VALIGDPDLLFLDEPTTGFDPSARRQAWEVIASLGELGKTVFLTTHYMDEAQRLADRVAIITAGEIVAEGAPGELGDRERRPATIRFRLPPGAIELPDGVGPAGTANGMVEIVTPDPQRVLHTLTHWALERGIELEALECRQPSLEDVYLELTGGESEPEAVP